MILTAEQREKVEQNIRLVQKVINDKVHGPYQLASIHMMIFFKSAASASAKLRQQIKAGPSLPMPIA